MGNFPGRIDAPDLNQAAPGFGNGLADDFRTLGLTFRPDDIRLALLLGPLDNEPCPLGVLLGDLFLLDGLGELAAKGHVGDGDVLKGDVELRGTAHQVGADAVGDGFSLGDELGGVELGDDGLEHFVSDRGQDPFVVVDPVCLSLSMLGCPSIPPRTPTW